MFLLEFLRGYDKINVVCARPERFFNRLIGEGVSLHNVKKLSLTAARFQIRRGDRRAVQRIAEEEGALIKRTGSGGLQAVLKRILRRPALIISLILACAALIALSRRVLAVKVSGADANLEREAEELIANEGIRRWSRIADIDPAALAEKLRMLDSRISYASVAAEGVVLRVKLFSGNVTETAERDRPSSIYADKDCVLLKLAVFDGKACVCAGEAVKRGQLLVSGDITPEGAESPVLVNSSAEILGETAYRFSINVAKTALLPHPSGNSKRLTRLSLFGLSIDSRTGFERYEAELTKAYSFSSAVLPLKIVSGTAHEILLQETALSREAMLEEALRRSDIELLSLPKGALMISKTTDIVWNDDGSLTMIINVHTVEKIGYSRYL